MLEYLSSESGWHRVDVDEIDSNREFVLQIVEEAEIDITVFGVIRSNTVELDGEIDVASVGRGTSRPRAKEDREPNGMVLKDVSDC